MPLSDSLVRELTEKFHTPLYVFEAMKIREQCRALHAAIPYRNKVIRYACKALTLQPVLEIVRNEGLAIDAVSINEVHRAMRAGFSAADVLYTGEGASRLVYEQLLERGILINCSSLDQLRLIAAIRPGARCSVRFNPGEGHGAHNKVNTGGPSSKHGIYYTQADEVLSVAAQNNLHIVGVHSHIGSGTDLGHWLRIKDLTFALARRFDNLEFVDLGGGLPVVYDAAQDAPMPLRDWGARLSESFEEFSRAYGREIQLQVEPGRFIVAECGHLIAEVQTVKSTPDYEFIIVNTGLNHNPRPAMYGSYHPIRFVSRDGREMKGEREYVVAGYLCESGDVFTVRADGTLAPRSFPEVRLGDLMVMGHVGAYSHAMKNDYNSMNLPASILIPSEGEPRVIERRGTLDDIIRREVEAY